MRVLILILTQIVLIAIGLKLVFSLIDQMIITGLKRGILPFRRLQLPRLRIPKQPKSPESQSTKQPELPKPSPSQVRDELNKRISEINRQSPWESQISRREWNQLLTKVQGDIPTAERLINHLRMKYPGHSDGWYIEKAIFDLERDNRR
jgi:hypothetical protein